MHFVHVCTGIVLVDAPVTLRNAHLKLLCCQVVAGTRSPNRHTGLPAAQLQYAHLRQAARDPGGALCAQHQAPGLGAVRAHALRHVVPVEAQRWQQLREVRRARVAGRQHECARRHASRQAHLPSGHWFRVECLQPNASMLRRTPPTKHV